MNAIMDFGVDEGFGCAWDEGKGGRPSYGWVLANNQILREVDYAGLGGVFQMVLI